MKQHQYSILLWLTATVCVLVASPALADTEKVADVRLETQTTAVVGKEIKQLSQVERPKASANFLVQSSTPQAEVVLVTGVKVNRTDKGVEVILETAV